MPEQSFAELADVTRRLCEEAWVLISRAQMVSAECARLRTHSGDPGPQRLPHESWDRFIDRYAETVLRDLPQEFRCEER